MKFCVICSKNYNAVEESLFKEYKDTCSRCRNILMDEAPDTPLYDSKSSSYIDDWVQEIETIVPGIFNGPECPLDFTVSSNCDCTYVTGCKGLKEKGKNKRVRNY